MRRVSMHDPWTEKLSDYLDGALDVADQRSIEAHLVA